CMPEYCGVISDRPTVRAQFKRVEQEEENFDFDVLEEALANTIVTNIDTVPADLKDLGPLTTKQQLLANSVVVDVRSIGEQQKKPLNLPGVEILTVPFFQINKQ
ncbi:MAG: tRNA uracil 4-sulfurtransferase ThiI, partial [Pseudomonadales bacterium]